MPVWLLVANLTQIVAFAVALLALGLRSLQDRVLRRQWRNRFVLRTRREKELAARQARTIRGPELREAIRWQAYWLADEFRAYGEENEDAEMRLCELLIKEAASLVNERIGTPRWRLDRLRDSVDFVVRDLLERDRWWRKEEFNREAAQVIYWKDIEMRQLIRKRTKSPRIPA